MAADLPPARDLSPRDTSPIRPSVPRHDTWTSPLWGHPDTVGGYWQAQPTAPPDLAPAPQAPPPTPPGRRLVVAAVIAVVLAVLVGTVGGFAFLRPDGADKAVAPPPSASLAPTSPASPPSPSAPSSPQPSPQTGQQPGTGGQNSALSADQQAAVAAVSPGLVDIVSTIGSDGQQGAGTGIVLTSDGLVLTNHHVVAGSTSLEVTDIANGKTYSATVLGYDKTHDVAVIRLKDASGLTVAPLGDSSKVQVGDEVVAIGNAGGVGGTPSAVAGPVTALDQEITVQDELTGDDARLSGLIEVQAAIRQGDSGGALVDQDAQVVGMITAASVGGRSSDTSIPTTGYAIPLDQAKQIADQIIAGQSSDTVHIGGTAFLGVQLSDLGQVGLDGVLVAGVENGSAADKAGITDGSVLTALGGQRVHSASQLRTAVGSHQPGDTVSVSWTDANGTSHTASVTLGTGPVG